MSKVIVAKIIFPGKANVKKIKFVFTVILFSLGIAFRYTANISNIYV